MKREEEGYKLYPSSFLLYTSQTAQGCLTGGEDGVASAVPDAAGVDDPETVLFLLAVGNMGVTEEKYIGLTLVCGMDRGVVAAFHIPYMPVGHENLYRTIGDQPLERSGRETVTVTGYTGNGQGGVLLGQQVSITL
jgi:hypothetical protein